MASCKRIPYKHPMLLVLSRSGLGSMQLIRGGGGSILFAVCSQSRILNFRVSRPGESHPEPLAEPYVSVSTHTAPTMGPRCAICQCANSAGSRRQIRAIHCAARRGRPRSLLYFCDAQRASALSSCRIA